MCLVKIKYFELNNINGFENPSLMGMFREIIFMVNGEILKKILIKGL